MFPTDNAQAGEARGVPCPPTGRPGLNGIEGIT